MKSIDHKRRLRTTLSLFFLVAISYTGISQEGKQAEKEIVIQDKSIVDDANQKNYSTATSSATRNSSSAVQADIGMPNPSGFELGSDISGSIQNSINPVTGKIAFSVPVSTVAASSINYPIALTYNGETSFTTGKQQNKYAPTSVVGVGWDLNLSKIVVDYNNSAARDDDTFYLLDATNSSRLVCIDKTSSIWKFQMEKYVPWIIEYHINSDYWKIIKDNGQTYYFGYSNTGGSNLPNSTTNSKESLIAFGNWIGDTKRSGGTKHTICWNISKIKDQWENTVDFKYELEEVAQPSSPSQTEASYLKEVSSSDDMKVIFNYIAKNIFEYYEPHQEHNEPDAYQERYEKKYLSSIDIYNYANSKSKTYALGHSLQGTSGNTKRYLTSLTQTSFLNGEAQSIPPQEFEYHYSGNFKGGLKHITYPSGGKVTYNYNNKYLFYNGHNRYVTTPNYSNDYHFYASLSRSNYNLYVRRSDNPITGNKHRFIFYRYWWNGEKWESNEFVFPDLIGDDYPGTGDLMQGFQSVLGEDYYGFIYDSGSKVDLHLWHLEQNSRTWKKNTFYNIDIGGPNDDNNDDDIPRFIHGDDFIAIGSHRTGKLWTYTWTGNNWRSQLINQGSGQFYYAANNNFILSLDEDGGPDMVTNVSYQDNYYIHYLDAEKKWNTKSWSANTGQLNSIENTSQFYPGTTIAGFVAHDNPEVFLRWDTDYNLIAIDNPIGAYNDNHIFQPVNNSLFTLVWTFDNSPTVAARFDGVDWRKSEFSSAIDYNSASFGLDMISHRNSTSRDILIREYSPNTDSFTNHTLIDNYPWYTPFEAHSLNSDFIIANNTIFKKSNQGPPALPFQVIGGLTYEIGFTSSDGLGHSYVAEDQVTNTGGTAGRTFKKGSYFFINKETGQLNNTSFGLKNYLRGNRKLGGWTPFLSPSSLWLRSCSTTACGSTFTPYIHRIIEDKVNNSMYDPVVSSMVMDDDNGGVRQVNYTYTNPFSTPENSITYYEEVTIEHKGFGSSSIGKTKTIFNTGNEDVRLAGLAKEIQVLDKNNILKSKTINNWGLILKGAFNGSFIVDNSYMIRLFSSEQETFYEGETVTTWTNNGHNTLGQLNQINTLDSKGLSQRRNITYAYEQYGFMLSKNMLNEPYETVSRVDNKIVTIEQNRYINSGGKAYLTETFSGTSPFSMRVRSEITNINNEGDVLEVHNGSGIYNTSLTGYKGKFNVASVANARYSTVVNALDVSYTALQNLSTATLKSELLKLYDRLPNAMINLTFHDDFGRVTNQIDERKEETYIYYDIHGRVDYITDGYGALLEKRQYNFGN